MNPFTVLVALVVSFVIGTLLFMFGWNVFIVGVLEFSREVDLGEALAGTLVLFIVQGVIVSFSKNLLRD